jgi:hypothetical protein
MSYLNAKNVTMLVAAYENKDVWYVEGNNDTCNENLIEGCKSHGLDKSCGAMLQGQYRRYRYDVIQAIQV